MYGGKTVSFQTIVKVKESVRGVEMEAVKVTKWILDFVTITWALSFQIVKFDFLCLS